MAAFGPVRVVAASLLTAAILATADPSPALAWPDLVGPEAVASDWRDDRPGARRLIRVRNLPEPFATPSVENFPVIVARPEGAWPQVPPGFAVDLLASGLVGPRQVVVAPNGDIFLSESGANRVRVLRLAPDGGVAVSQVYAEGFNLPFGLAFWPPEAPRWLYVANTDSVVRFRYRPGDLAPRGPAGLVIASADAGGPLRGGGHGTRDLAFSRDGRRLFVSVGSLSNAGEGGADETNRAAVLQFTPHGAAKEPMVYASGLRNPVGLAVDPATGNLWTSVNERDALGDDLVPDYVTRVREGQFYGWPWFYMGGAAGGRQDPRHPGARPELQALVRTPDVLLQAHSASLGLDFYDGTAFPGRYRGQIFAAEHGSWNRSNRTGSKVVRVELEGGVATGWYEDFMTGFTTPDGASWGRPADVAVTADGALLVTDDAGGVLWRVRHGP